MEVFFYGLQKGEGLILTVLLLTAVLFFGYVAIFLSNKRLNKKIETCLNEPSTKEEEEEVEKLIKLFEKD